MLLFISSPVQYKYEICFAGYHGNVVEFARDDDLRRNENRQVIWNMAWECKCLLTVALPAGVWNKSTQDTTREIHYVAVSKVFCWRFLFCHSCGCCYQYHVIRFLLPLCFVPQSLNSGMYNDCFFLQHENKEVKFMQFYFFIRKHMGT